LDAGTTIHVIDDDPAVRDSLKLLLELRGHSVATYESGERFLRGRTDAGAARPHCILLDIDMPGMNGLAVLEALRAEPADIPVIVITGRGEGIQPRIEEAGAAGFVEKPFAEETLIACIDRVLKARQAPRDRLPPGPLRPPAARCRPRA
jgi:two-component system response regulator FixJ